MSALPQTEALTTICSVYRVFEEVLLWVRTNTLLAIQVAVGK